MKEHEPHHLAAEHEQPDQWHRHSAQEGVPQTEHTAVASPKVLAISFLVITFSIAATVFVLVIFFDHYTANFKASQMESTTLSTPFNDYKKQWDEFDSRTYGWVDAKAGTVRIPIDQAMGRVVEKYKAPAGAGAPN